MTATEDFFAELAQSMYDESPITYFESPCDFDSETPTGSIDANIKAVYQLQTQFNYDNMRVYKPLLNNPNILTQPIYILFRGTSTGWDIYRDLNILLNYGSYGILQGVNTEITNIYNSLKTFIQTEGRAIHIIGHSLGCYYGIHLLHNLLIQESPNLDQFEETFNLTMFNPLILADTATEFFRSETLINSQKTARQFAKENIAIHNIRGDFLAPLLIQAGVGHVYAYDAQTERDIDTTDFLLGTWLGQITNVISRDSYLNDDNHKISAFTGHLLSINGHSLIDSLNALTTNSQVSIITKHQTDLRVALDTDASMTEVEYNALSAIPHHLYLYDDTTNLDSGKSIVDYPHGTSTIDHYNWTIIKRDNDEFILSQVGNVKYINFEAILRPTAYTKSLLPNSEVSSSGEIYRFLVRQGINEYVMCIDNGLNAPKAFKVNQNSTVPDTSITSLQIPHTMLDTGTLAEFDTYGETDGITLAHRDRYILQIGATLDGSNFHISNRRTNNNIPIILPPAPIGMRALFHNPSLGYQKAIINFGTKYVTAIPPESWNYKYTLDVNMWAPGTSGPVVITWDDNTIVNNNDDVAETIWNIIALDHGTKYRIQNTQHPTVYLGNNSTTNPNNEVGDGPFNSTIYNTAQPDLYLEQSGSEWIITFKDHSDNIYTMYSFSNSYSSSHGGYEYIDWQGPINSASYTSTDQTKFTITFV